MLVIARRAGEAIRIADNVEIVVISVEGGRVRLGIKAPRELRVLRAELESEVAGANQSAAGPADGGAAALLRDAAGRSRAVRENPPPA